MAGVSLPVTRPSGRALVVGNPPARADAVGTLQNMGYGCAEADDPYAAMAEICRRPMVYRAMILSLSSLHREELALIPGIKRRFPHVEVWLTHTDGRQASLVEAMRLGADGLLSGEGLHRIALAGGARPAPYVPAPSADAPAPPPRHLPAAPPRDEAVSAPEPIEPVASGENEAMPAVAPGAPPSPQSHPPRHVDLPDESNAIGEPVLSVDELRALLQEQPLPPAPAPGAGE